MELCLGTVQFGMDYGVFNQPKKDMDYCVHCLDYATQNGIHAIDTAATYGNAEEVIGEFLKKRTIAREQLFLSTKLLPNILDDVKSSEYEKVIIENIEKSLRTLHTDYIDACFFHSSRYIFSEEMMQALQIVKEKGMAKEVGVSIYYEEEAVKAMNNPTVQYVQTPYSVFDHRMKEIGLLDETTRGNLHVDTRTTFVKGLIRLQEDEVPEHLAKAKPILRKLDEICAETGYSRIELAIGYVKREQGINHLVFGIRDLNQLKQDIKAFDTEIPAQVIRRLEQEFQNIDMDIVVPSLWKR
jgi:aryl-alcohol dehydrogenase-like predicted oxidoreductase